MILVSVSDEFISAIIQIKLTFQEFLPGLWLRHYNDLIEGHS